MSIEMTFMRCDGAGLGDGAALSTQIAALIPGMSACKSPTGREQFLAVRRSGARISPAMEKVIRSWPRQWCCELRTPNYWIKIYIDDEPDVQGFYAYAEPNPYPDVDKVLDSLETALSGVFSFRPNR